jgi:hypothetical protein
MRTDRHTLSPSPARLLEHWGVLCARIGERRAGTGGEQAAADYLQAQFRAAGLKNVHAEPFPCTAVEASRAEVSFDKARLGRPVLARALAGSPGTPGARAVEGELVWIEMPEQADRLFTRRLRGKVVVLVGPLPTRADLHRRLVATRPAAVLHADDRLPFDWAKDDGAYPSWVRRYGMPPTAAIPFRQAWDVRQRGATRGRVRIAVRLRPAASQNVAAEIPGRRPDGPLLLLGAHHDTQCHNSGADDNASGVVALLELARLLAGRRLRRTIRFVSFGAEEQLSVGSGCYVARHRQELRGLGLVLNLDSVASVLGHHWLIHGGTPPLGGWLRARLARHGLDVVEKRAPMPFADHFPFSVFGVPAATLYRPNMDSGMRWQHHSAQDNLQNVSAPELARVIRAVGAMVMELADRTDWPFGHGLDTKGRAETFRLARDLYGFRPGPRAKRR